MSVLKKFDYLNGTPACLHACLFKYRHANDVVYHLLENSKYEKGTKVVCLAALTPRGIDDAPRAAPTRRERAALKPRRRARRSWTSAAGRTGRSVGQRGSTKRYRIAKYNTRHAVLLTVRHGMRGGMTVTTAAVAVVIIKIVTV